MNKNLLVIGAGQYGVVIKELALTLGSFDRIDFLDDNNERTLGTTDKYKDFVEEYHYAFPAIGNADVRLEWIEKLEKAGYDIPILKSPFAYVSCSAQLGKGTVVEPMAVVHANTLVGKGCIISANATINHNSVCSDGCHIDCGAVVGSNVVVPSRTKVKCGEALIKR